MRRVHNGWTVLLTAAVTFAGCSDSIHDLVGREDFAQVQVLLDDQPELVNARNAMKKTPLFDAVTYGVPKMIDLLVARGADVNAADVTGMRPLHAAAMWDKEDEAACLLGHGADISATDDFGDTPLHLAAIWGRKDTAALLIARGANPAAVNKEGLTPLDLAKRHRQEEMIEFLQQTAGVSAANQGKSATP